jgi:hypothetical protein
MMGSSERPSHDGFERPAPMPVDAPPVGPARARRRRLLELRESARGHGSRLDADAVASAIARRALFTQRLTARLVEETRAESTLAVWRDPV